MVSLPCNADVRSRVGVSRIRALAWARVARVLVLLLADSVALLGAGAIAYLGWAAPVRNQPPILWLELVPLVSLFFVAYGLSGLYPGFGLGAVETLRRTTKSTSVVFAAVAGIVFLAQLPHRYSRMTFALLWLGAIVLVPLARFQLLSQVGRWQWWQEPSVLVGMSAKLESTFEVLATAASIGYRPVAVIATDPRPPWTELHDCPVFAGTDYAQRLATLGVRVAIVDDEQGIGRSLRHDLLRHFHQVIVLRSVERIEIAEPRHLGSAFGYEFRNALLRRRTRFLKRTFDLLAATTLLICFAPLMGLAIGAVKIASPGPALFRQVRRGLHGRSFELLKIRTMMPDADEKLRQLLGEDSALETEWNDRFKLTGDPRIIRGVGAAIRRFSIDELPQLWNVMTGDMSLVGPRPLPDYHLNSFEPSLRELRERVRPGLTGFWQVTSSQDGSATVQQARDEYYVRNWSFWLDIYILALTAVVVLRRPGDQ